MKKRICVLLIIIMLPFFDIKVSAAKIGIVDNRVSAIKSVVGAVVNLSESAYSIPNESEFLNKLSALRIKYTNGGTWSGTYYENGVAKAWSCHGYACQLVYEVFGVQYYNGGLNNSVTYSMGTLNAGDLVRINSDSHSVFITRVTSDRIYFTDANYDYKNGIRWDASYSISEMRNRFTYKMHLSSNTLSGNAVPKPTNAWVKAAHTSIPTGSTNAFTFGATNATSYNIRIDKDGALWKFEQGITTGKTYTFSDEGNYTAFIAGINSSGYADSSKVSFSVFEPVLLGRFFVANITNSKAVKNLAADETGNIILKDKTNGDEQKWCFELQDDNTYKITNVLYNKCMDVSGSVKTEPGTNIGIWGEAGTAAQRFYIRYNNNGFGIVPKANTDLALDMYNGYMDDGTNIQDWTWNESNAQKFSIDGYHGTTPINTSDYNGHTYECYNIETTWNQAYRICENKGGHLVTITSKEENDFIHDLCKDYCSLVWIGANVFNREPTKENWYWITGEPFSYDGWNTGEPNYDQSIERYGVMFIGTGNIGTWNDTGLNSSTYFYRHNMVRGFVCEYDNGDVNAEQYTATARVEMNGTAYEVFDYAVDWQTAEAICEAKGGHLVRIDSNIENESVVALANRGKKSEYWINATDRVSEGIWMDSDGNNLIYTNWLSGEPNNDFNAEQYAALQKTDGKWYDFKGFSPMYRSVGFICEYEPERKVELTLYPMNSTNDNSSINFDYGEIIETLPEPVKENYEFLGWYTKPDGGEKINLPYTITNDTELFAHWQIKNVPSTEHPQSGILGDSDSDGLVTIFDATTIQRQIAGLAVSSYSEKAADCDGDGRVTVVDATAIQRHLAGLSTDAKGIGEPIQ